ncbi:MAG: type II secretion system F family protein [Propionibacteriaceae bacterium]|jgi:Flp pilus assembly protein TadB|nr:type II secretion system F family protein [Propionibacteriaceae bacterium]
MSVFVVLCGALVLGGMFAIVSGAFFAADGDVNAVSADPQRGGRASLSQRVVRAWQRLRPRERALTAVGLAAGAVAYLVTSWLLAPLLVPAVVIGLPLLLSDTPNHEADLLAALDRWVRALVASLPTGKSIVEAIKACVPQVPEPLHDHVELLAIRLSQGWTLDDALAVFADEADSAQCNAVAASLLVAGRRGGIGATDTLSALADSIQDRLAAAREIALERAKPRIVARQITFITGSVVAFSCVTNPGYFAAYSSGIGSAILVALVGLFFLALAKLRVMAAAPVSERILVLSPERGRLAHA